MPPVPVIDDLPPVPVIDDLPPVPLVDDLPPEPDIDDLPPEPDIDDSPPVPGIFASSCGVPWSEPHPVDMTSVRSEATAENTRAIFQLSPVRDRPAITQARSTYTHVVGVVSSHQSIGTYCRCQSHRWFTVAVSVGQLSDENAIPTSLSLTTQEQTNPVPPPVHTNE